MRRAANFSDDHSRRFHLIRDWSGDKEQPKTVVFVGFNSSLADGEKDDMTVRKYVGFAKRWGFERIVAVNLIATVSVDPSCLPPWDEAAFDRMNLAYLKAWTDPNNLDVHRVVVAWGAPSPRVARTIGLKEHIHQFRQVCRPDLYCIGQTKHGAPLHASRTAYTSRPDPFSWNVQGTSHAKT